MWTDPCRWTIISHMMADYRGSGACAASRTCRKSCYLEPTYVCKTIGFLLIIALVCFFAEEYITFGMWTASSYQSLTTCTEQYYNFPVSETGDSLINDKSLMTKCGIYSSNNSDTLNITQSFNTISGRPPNIITKCGSVKPTLLSFFKPRQMNTSDNYPVPNIVHYVSLGSWEFKLLNYLSFRSTSRHIEPSFIFVHGDGFPHGIWWERTLREVPNIYHVQRQRPIRIQGRKSRWLEHSTDIIRLETILQNGGIYLDTDIIVLKSFEPLRQYELTLGRETYYGLGSGVIIARAHSPFVCVWFNVFREYNPFPWNWAYYAVHTPHKLSKVVPPGRIHIEEQTLHRPSFEEAELLFKKRIDWSKKYSIHVWGRYGTVPRDLREIRSLNTTLGEIMRFIYYNSTDILY